MMTGACTAGSLHTLDMIERPFYIQRTPCRILTSRSAGTQSQRRRPAIPTLAFSRALRAFFPRSDSDHPLQQEVLAKRDLYEA
jgi:hypothetical protein